MSEKEKFEPSIENKEVEVPEGFYILKGNKLVATRWAPHYEVKGGKFFEITNAGQDRTEVSHPETLCHGGDASVEPSDCSKCGAHFQGWYAKDRSKYDEDSDTYKEFRVEENWKPQHDDLTYAYPKWDKDAQKTPVTFEGDSVETR